MHFEVDKKYRLQFWAAFTVGVIFLIYFWTICRFQLDHGWIISKSDVTVDNLLFKLRSDVLVMSLIPLIIIWKFKRKLKDIGLSTNNSPMVVLLSIVYIIFFCLHGDFSIGGTYIAFFYLVIIAFSEEVIYRGYVYTRMRSYNRILAILISGILFGITHAVLPGIMNHLSYAHILFNMLSHIGGGILMGYFFIYLMEKSESIFVPILIHALLDYSVGSWGVVIGLSVVFYYVYRDRNIEMKKKYIEKQENI